VQRLFSTFPDGWPGTGLAFLRAVAAIPPIHYGLLGLLTVPLPAQAMLQLAAAVTGGLLLVGLWTPVAGVLMAVVQVCLLFSHPADPLIHVLLGALGVALAMLGPGAWSMDARLFGRKRIQFPQR
jgi:putative oxidoreductase